MTRHLKKDVWMLQNKDSYSQVSRDQTKRWDTAAHGLFYCNRDLKFSSTQEYQVHYYEINKIESSAYLLVIQSVSTQKPVTV